MKISEFGPLAALAAALALAATPALAQGRPSTTAMSCAQAKAVVDQRGAIVLGTGGQTYDRFVRQENFCPLGYYARAAWAPTRDKAQCYIGYYCDTAPPFMRW